MAAFPDALTSERLRLVRMTRDAIDECLVAMELSFDALHRWMQWAAAMPTQDSLYQFVSESTASFDADKGWGYFIREIDGGLLVGGTGLHRRGGDDELEIGYWIRSDRTGRGYATEASRTLTDAAFAADLEIATVKISMDRANASSAAVPRKLGFGLCDEYEREKVTPGHSGNGVAWCMDREIWQAQSS
jgi:RimJ/RimL family protein N-acetyltransferase